LGTDQTDFASSKSNLEGLAWTSLIFFAIEFAGMFTGVSLFMPTANAYYIFSHFFGALFVGLFVCLNWEITAYVFVRAFPNPTATVQRDARSRARLTTTISATEHGRLPVHCAPRRPSRDSQDVPFPFPTKKVPLVLRVVFVFSRAGGMRVGVCGDADECDAVQVTVARRKGWGLRKPGYVLQK